MSMGEPTACHLRFADNFSTIYGERTDTMAARSFMSMAILNDGPAYAPTAGLCGNSVVLT